MNGTTPTCVKEAAEEIASKAHDIHEAGFFSLQPMTVESILLKHLSKPSDCEELKRSLRLALIEGRHFFKGSWVEQRGMQALGETTEQMLATHRRDNLT